MRYSNNMVMISLLVIFVVLTTGGCLSNIPPIITPNVIKDSPTPESTMEITTPVDVKVTESTPHVSPYIDVSIETVEVQYLYSDRTKVNLLIHGTLPDQCQYGFYSMEKRDQNSVKIILKGIHPPDFSCSRTAQSIVYELLLGKDLPESERGFSPGDYELVVNGFSLTFTVK